MYSSPARLIKKPTLRRKIVAPLAQFSAREILASIERPEKSTPYIPQPTTKPPSVSAPPTLKKPSEQPVLCCPEVKYNPGHAFDIPNLHHSLITSLISELTGTAEQQRLDELTGNTVIESPPYIPLSFAYCVEITTRVPAAKAFPFPYPGVTLAPEKPWRWFVLMDEGAFLEELKKENMDVEMSDISEEKSDEEMDMNDHMSVDEEMDVVEESTSYDEESDYKDRKVYNEESDYDDEETVIDEEILLTGRKRFPDGVFEPDSHRLGLMTPLEHWKREQERLRDAHKHEEISRGYTPQKRVLAPVIPTRERKWVEVRHEDLALTMSANYRLPEHGVKIICNRGDHDSVWNFQVLQNRYRIPHDLDEFFTQSDDGGKKPDMNTFDQYSDSETDSVDNAGDDGDYEEEEEVEEEDEESIQDSEMEDLNSGWAPNPRRSTRTPGKTKYYDSSEDE